MNRENGQVRLPQYVHSQEKIRIADVAGGYLESSKNRLAFKKEVNDVQAMFAITIRGAYLALSNGLQFQSFYQPIG